MSLDTTKPIHYKRARFSTELPVDRFYSSSHFWLKEVANGLWRVGFTKFATRMLGEIVEFHLDIQSHDLISVGRIIGHIEALKAVSDIYCLIDGTLQSLNASLDEDVSIISSDPYTQGWLYEAQGSPDPNFMDVHGYLSLLDQTIDRLREQKNHE